MSTRENAATPAEQIPAPAFRRYLPPSRRPRDRPRRFGAAPRVDAATAPAALAAASRTASRTASRFASRFPQWVLMGAWGQGFDFGALCTTEESQYSSLMPYQMPQVRAVYATEIPTEPSKVIDATAHIGCDLVLFCRMFPTAALTAIERSPETAELLRTNVTRLAEVLRCEVRNSVEVVESDCVEYLAEDHRADLVYFDPPWGGPDYYRAGSPSLTLGGRPLGDVVGETLARNAPLVVAKLPANASLQEFAEVVGGHTEHGVDLRPYDILKPSGQTAYRLVFVRALGDAAEVKEG